MTESNTASAVSRSRAAAARAVADAQHGSRLGLTRGQRVLATATAAAILLSGVNALVQVMRVLVEYCLARP